MIKIDLTNVEEATDFPKLKAGGYIAKIYKVEDVENKQYLKIYYDIAEGEFAGYYKDLAEKFNKWNGSFIRSYKETALSFFKGFITALENSNTNYKFSENEQEMVGKFLGVVLAEEEYENQSGEIRVRLVVNKTCSVDKIRNNDFVVPEKKTILPSNMEYAVDDSDEKLPWDR